MVVLDPGHGGRDPGAIGIGGLREKDINTTISKPGAAAPPGRRSDRVNDSQQ